MNSKKIVTKNKEGITSMNKWAKRGKKYKLITMQGAGN